MSVFTPISKKGNAKECANYCTIALISHANKVKLKIRQARLQQYVNKDLPDVQARFRKGRGTRNQVASIRWNIRKAREFQKNITFCFIDYAKAFKCVDYNKLWKILKEMGIPEHLTCLQGNLYADQEATVRAGNIQPTPKQPRGRPRTPVGLLPGPWSLQCCPWPDRLYPELVPWELDPCRPHRPVGTRDGMSAATRA